MTDATLSHTTYATITESNAILDRYIIFLKSNEYEMIGAERFGCNLREYVDEPKIADTYNRIATKIRKRTAVDFPEIAINSLQIGSQEGKTIYINLNIKIISTGDEADIATDIGA